MMLELTSLTYGLVAIMQRKDRAALTVALSFLLIETFHSICDFDYASIHYLSIALFTLLPVSLCRYLDKDKSSRMIQSCLGLVTIYFAAWICNELGWPESQFKWPHIAILVYQFGVLNGGRGIMDEVSNILANARKRWIMFYLHYHSGNP